MRNYGQHYQPPMGGTDGEPEHPDEPQQDTTPCHCGLCQWAGRAADLTPTAVPDPNTPGEIIYVPGCPSCLSDQALEYYEPEQYVYDRLVSAVVTMTNKQRALMSILTRRMW